jgi:hypothetical protein
MRFEIESAIFISKRVFVFLMKYSGRAGFFGDAAAHRLSARR